MAKIPVRATAEIAPHVPGRTGIPGGAFQGIGPGLQALGDVGSRIAATELSDQRRRDAESLRAKSSLDRVRASAGIVSDLNDLGDRYRTGIVDGSINPEGAGPQFDEEVDRAIAARLDGLAPEDAEHVRAHTLDSRGRVKNALGDAVRVRVQGDIRTGLADAEEIYVRNAGRDRPTAVKEFDATLTALGPKAGLTPEQVQQRRQRFKETVAFNAGSQLVRDARDDMKELTAIRGRINSDEFADLDPARRGQLEQHVLARQQYLTNQAEIAQRRAEADAERRLRQGEHAYNAMEKMIDRGALPNPETLAIAQKATAGTPYADALGALIKDSAERAGFASRPPAQQRAEILARRARANREGSSPAEEARIARMESINREAERELKEEPLTYATNRGIIDQVQPLQVTDLQSLLPQLASRVQQAQTVAAYTDTPVSPLMQAEAEQVSKLLAPLPVEQRAQALAQIGTVMRDRQMLTAFARQLDGKDRAMASALMYGDTRTTKGRHVGELLLRGQVAIKDGTVKLDAAKETGLKALIAKEIGDAYQNEELRQRFIESAYFIAAGLQSEGSTDVPQAVKLATGGLRKNSDGSKVPLPYGWTEDEFDKRLRQFTAAEIGAPLQVGKGEQRPDENVYVGAQPVPVDRFIAQLPQASLVHAGQGKYVVRAGSGFVTDKAGRRVVLDFAK